MTSFALTLTDRPTPADERVEIVNRPVFGAHFTDHMALATWNTGQGWHDRQIAARRPFVLHPGAATFHYGQEIFEGMKAYRQPDGGVALFRPERNAARFARSAERLAMAPLDEDDFVAAVTELVDVDRDWVPAPDGEQSLYIRPFEIASETLIGVRAATEYTFCVIASPVGPYYPEPVSLWATPTYTRAAAGGTGAAKCGGNYAASLAAQTQAAASGCDQAVFLDTVERKWVEELGGMNVFFVMRDGQIVTPELTGTILEGVTRSALLQVAADRGYTPVERRVSIDEWRDGIASGEITEVFACGTAAVITPIGRLAWDGGEAIINSNETGPVAAELRAALLDVQFGRADDPHGWMTRLV